MGSTLDADTPLVPSDSMVLGGHGLSLVVFGEGVLQSRRVELPVHEGAGP